MLATLFPVDLCTDNRAKEPVPEVIRLTGVAGFSGVTCLPVLDSGLLAFSVDFEIFLILIGVSSSSSNKESKGIRDYYSLNLLY